MFVDAAFVDAAFVDAGKRPQSAAPGVTTGFGGPAVTLTGGAQDAEASQPEAPAPGSTARRLGGQRVTVRPVDVDLLGQGR
jgi:hypothetical protein